MATDTFAAFEEIWVIDSEFICDRGNTYDVVCFCGVELLSGRTFRKWRDELTSVPPFRTDDKSLVVVFAGTAEIGSMLALGWPLPVTLLDLSPEYRLFVNGRAAKDDRRGLLDALRRYGLPGMEKAEKDYWRDIVLHGPPYTDTERVGVLDYCMADCTETAALFRHTAPAIDLPRALWRSEFVKVSALEEYRELPIDMEVFSKLRDQATWDHIRKSLIPAVDAAFDVYDGRVFKHEKFERYLARRGIPWPRTETGRLDLRESTFREMAKAQPEIAPLHELRVTQSKLRTIKLQVGADGRARTVLWPFSSKTGRTQPKASQYLFGPSCWVRSLLKPEPGMAICYCDWSAMEFFVGAALAGDRAMLAAYDSDPYLSTAIAFGYAPPGATSETHGDVRDNFKIVLLAGQYGMTALTLAGRLGCSTIEAAEILAQHRRVYATYWAWNDAWLANALTRGQMCTPLGWTFWLDNACSERTITNWPVQSTAAEIMRTAAVWANKYGLRLLGTVHDALIIESPLHQIERDVALLQEIMRRASRAVLALQNGLALKSKAEPVSKIWTGR